MELLFSYGTLQNASVQLKLFGRLLHGSKEVLKGYQLSPIEVTDEAFLAGGNSNYQLMAIRTNENDAIEGMAYELTAQELAQADKYEPKEYERVEVALASGKMAWIYAATG